MEISDKNTEIDDQLSQYTEDLIKRTTNLNQREIDLANGHFDEIQLADKGHTFCDKCKKSEKQLQLEWELQQKLREVKGLPLKDRKRPHFVVQEKGGRGLHIYKKNGNQTIMVQFGNVDRNCYSCNAIFHKNKTQAKSEEDLPFTARVSVRNRKKFKDMLNNLLVKTDEVCYDMIIQKYSSSNVLNCSQQMLYNAFKQERGTMFDLIQVDDYPNIQCEWHDCTGEHIIRKGFPPVQVLSDFQAEQQEIETLAEKQGSPKKE